MVRIKTNRIFALLAALLICLSMSGCRKEYTRLDRPNTTNPTTTTTTTIAALQEQPEEFSVSAPQFHTGSYQMVSTSTVEEAYSSQGSTFLTYHDTTSYSYNLGITRADDGSLTAVYTYTRAAVNVEQNYAGSVSTYSFSTDDISAMTEENAWMYQLIGKSFSVSVDPSMNITGLNIETGLAELVDNETLATMALDLFYPLPQTIANGTSWQISDSVASVYSAKKLQDNMLVVGFTGPEIILPYIYTDPNGQYTVTYTSYPPMDGSLWISTADRAIQEMSTSSVRSGKYTDASGEYDIVTATYTTCAVSAK